MIDLNALQGLYTVVVGAAREGTALTRFLSRCGARVMLNDSKPGDALGDEVLALERMGVTLALGTPMVGLDDVDLLFLSPGVPPWAPIVQAARARGVPISSEPRLFCQLCPAPVVGITGSSGKTTTTALTGEMYAASGRTTWVGGNIGHPLIEKLSTSEAPDVAVMELSSFQLEFYSPDYQGADVAARRSAASRVVSVEGSSPHVAAITNITPNHLDRHPSMEAYTRAKSHILAFQGVDDWAVLNRDDDRSYGLRSLVRGQLLTFGLKQPVKDGACLRGDGLYLRHAGREELLCQRAQIGLRGRHNIANVLTAACCAAAGGVPTEAIREAAVGFAGVPHRIEAVRRWRDVLFVNDSIATSPERAVAALRAFDEPLVLLAGGRDKHLPWDDWADLVLERARVVIAFGEAVPIIEQALQAARSRTVDREGLVMQCVLGLDEAVEAAAGLARPGDVVLLSPGGTSFDAFRDFEARGQRFAELVLALP